MQVLYSFSGVVALLPKQKHSRTKSRQLRRLERGERTQFTVNYVCPICVPTISYMTIVVFKMPDAGLLLFKLGTN